jgi:phosphatidylserine decarboxylase
MTIDPGAGRAPLAVEQIVGLIARRIECWPKPGDTVASGQRYGIIYFGSQAAVHFPAGSTCTVKVGDKMTAGVTEIGAWTAK